jgi:hypothetical protein
LLRSDIWRKRGASAADSGSGLLGCLPVEVMTGSTCVPQLNVARCGEPSSGGVARRALTNVGLRRCWLLGDSRRGRLLGVGEGVFTRRLGEERFSDGVGEGVARGPGEVRFNSSVGVDGREPKLVGVDGREPKLRVAPDRSPTVPRPAAPEPASVWSAWRTDNQMQKVRH